MKLILRFFRIVNKFNNQTVLYGAVFLYPKTGRNERIWHLPESLSETPQSGVELPKELEDAFIQEHISTRDGYTEQKVQEALANHKPQETKAEDSEEYKALKKQFEDFKTEQTEKETKAAKAKEIREVLTSAGLSGKALEMASKLFDAKSLELDESGKAKDFDNLVSAAKTEYADDKMEAGQKYLV